MMIETKKKEVWKLIQKKGDELKGTLPNHPKHAYGRNPYAHISSLINEEFGCSYKDVDRENIENLVNFIKSIKG